VGPIELGPLTVKVRYPKLAELVVLELELQLLVEAVAEIGADQFAYGVVTGRIHLVLLVCGRPSRNSPWRLTVV